MSTQWTIGLTRQDLTEIRLNETIDGLPSGIKAVMDDNRWTAVALAVESYLERKER